MEVHVGTPCVAHLVWLVRLPDCFFHTSCMTQLSAHSLLNIANMHCGQTATLTEQILLEGRGSCVPCHTVHPILALQFKQQILRQHSLLVTLARHVLFVRCCCQVCFASSKLGRAWQTHYYSDHLKTVCTVMVSVQWPTLMLSNFPISSSMFQLQGL